MTDPYTEQAAKMLATATFVAHPEDDPPGYEVRLLDSPLNMTIGVAAVSEADATEKLLPMVADALRRQDPNYVPPPAPPSPTDVAIVAVADLPPTATVGDVVAVVKQAIDPTPVPTPMPTA